MFFEKTEFSILRHLPTEANLGIGRSFQQVFLVFPVENSKIPLKTHGFPQGFPQPVENFVRDFFCVENFGEKVPFCSVCTKIVYQ